MSAAAIRGVVRRLGPPADPPTDADLVAAFASRRDSDAFAALVARHGSTVFGVCRRVLGDSHDAEDAFQAVFLVLALKVKAIRPPGAVGGWLYGVAVRTASKAKVAAARRRRREMIAASNAASRERERPEASTENTELQSVLDAELAKLPETMRAVVVLCDLQGKTRAEAAAELGCPEGTVAARLHRARKKLAEALSRRGLALPATGLAAVLTPAAVSADASRSALAAALGSAPPVVLALAREVTRSMTATKTVLAFGVLSLLAGGLFAAGAMMSAPVADAPGSPVQSLTEVKVEQPAKAKPPASEWKEAKVLDHVGWLVGSVAYSPDGKSFFVGGTDGHVRAYDSATWKQLWEYKEGGKLAAIAVALDGKPVAATFKDGVRFLDAASGKIGDVLEEKDSEPRAVAFFPNSIVIGGGIEPVSRTRKVIFGNARGYFVKTWTEWPKVSTITTSTVAAGKQPADEYAVPLAVEPSGMRVVMTGPIDRDTGTNVLWANSAGSGASGGLLEGHKATVTSAAWSKDGKFIVTGDVDGVVINWDAARFKEKSRLLLAARVASLAISDDGKHIAAAVVRPVPGVGLGAYAEEVFAWKIASQPDAPELMSSHKAGAPFKGVASLAFSPDGKSLASAFCNFDHLSKLGDLTGKIRVFALEPEKPKPDEKPLAANQQQWKNTAALTDHGALVNGVAIAPDGKSFAAATNGNVTCWDSASQKVLWTTKGGDAPFRSLAYSPDGKHICIAGKLDVTRLDAKTGKADSWNDNDQVKFGKMHALAYSPDGDRLAASDGYTTRVQRLVGGEVSMTGPPNVKEKAGELPAGVAWSKDGKRLAFIRHEKTDGRWLVVLWGAGSGEPMKLLAGHTDTVTAVAWSKDGKVIASGGQDGLVILWDATSGKEVWRKQLGDGGRVHALAISPEDNTVAVGVGLGARKSPERVVLLAAKDGGEVQHLLGPGSLPVASVAWSHDGKFLITGCGEPLGVVIKNLDEPTGEVVIWEQERKP